LRYPDGHVRRIRYPGRSQSHSPRIAGGDADKGAQGWGSQPPSPPSPQGDWHICSEIDEACCFDPGFNDDIHLPGAAPVEELWGARRETEDTPPAAAAYTPKDTEPIEEFGALPSSPAALLEYLSSDKFTSERRKLQDKVQSSYEVLHGCPWLNPRPLLTIAIRKEGREFPSSYTLPVAIEQVS
jgi:hypothetical protein